MKRERAEDGPDDEPPLRVISGGQTGVDTAALRAARAAGVQTGGWAPRGYLTASGPAPELWLRYGLREMGASPRPFPARSMRNVDEADVTIAFRPRPSVGTDKTIGYALRRAWPRHRPGWPAPDRPPADAVPPTAYRPVLVLFRLPPDSPDGPVDAIAHFLRLHWPSVVNVCGPRALTPPVLGPRVQEVLRRAFDSYARARRLWRNRREKREKS